MLAAGGNVHPAATQLSIAERVRQQLAAKAAGGGAARAAVAKAGVGGRKRAAAQMEGPIG